MTEATCVTGVQKLAAEIAALNARRVDLADEVSEAAPDVPDIASATSHAGSNW
jgi:hypothetical protein